MTTPLQIDDEAKIRFICDCEIEVLHTLSEDEEPESEPKLFKKGTEVEIFVVDYPQKHTNEGFVDDESKINVQFPDGSMAYCISLDWFEVVEIL